jgi:hypothetical protein
MQSTLRDVPARPGDVVIRKNDAQCLIEIQFPDLQGGRDVLSKVFYLAKCESGEVGLTGQIYAADPYPPSEFVLRISPNVTRTTITIDELLHLPEPDE